MFIKFSYYGTIYDKKFNVLQTPTEWYHTDNIKLPDTVL